MRKGKKVEAGGELLHTGHAEDLSRTSERAFVPLPMPLRCEKDGMLEMHT